MIFEPRGLSGPMRGVLDMWVQVDARFRLGQRTAGEQARADRPEDEESSQVQSRKDGSKAL